jgi:peptidyl-dipeptidase A
MKKTKKIIPLLGCVVIFSALFSCIDHEKEQVNSSNANQKQYTEKDLEAFLEKASADTNQLVAEYTKAAWVASTFITPDSSATFNVVTDKYVKKEKALVAQVKVFDNLTVEPSLRRQVNILKRNALDPVPNDSKKAKLLSTLSEQLIAASTQSLTCNNGDDCRNTTKLNTLMAQSNDYDELLKLWLEGGQQYKPMKALYQSRVDLANQGAKDSGYANVGTMWRSAYDMPEHEFPAELEKVWRQIKPLYSAMQCHIKSKLNDKYPQKNISLDKPTPAHLFANVEASDWSNLQALVTPKNPALTRNYDITAALVTQDYDALKIARTAEGFYTSMGFALLPDTYWQRSQLTKPNYPEGGYASTSCTPFPYNATGTDQRLHMCIEANKQDFDKVHSIMEFNYYALAYNKHQPYYFQNLSGDPAAFFAMNNTMEMSLTPEYYNEVGLLDTVPTPSHDIAFLMQQAFDKVFTMPYYLAVENWRWGVYSGAILPKEYSKAWWDLREKYQDVIAPIKRSEDDFDAGASRYVTYDRSLKDQLMAGVLSFQFQKALCEARSNTENDGVRHRCSVYQSKEAGDRMQAMFKLGKSVPWQQALSTLVGDPESRVNLDGTAINEYFAPLKQYLDEQNKGLSCAI